MFIPELIFALLIAFLLSLIFSLWFRGYGWGMGFFLFFLVLFLVTWAGGIWITPFGPVWMGVPWLSFVLVGLLIALIMATLLPDNRRSDRIRQTGQETETVTTMAVDLFFWVLMVSLVIVVIIGYAVR